MKPLLKALCTVCLIILIFRCVLLVGRFASSNIAAYSCSNSSDHHSSTYGAWMVTVYYSVLEIMRLAEYIVIGINFYMFWLIPEGKYAVGVSNISIWARLKILLICLLPGSLAIFVVICQIKMEEHHEHIESTIEVCPTYNDVSKIYFAYCALNFGRYLYAFFVRILMVINTDKIEQIWQNSYERLTLYVGKCANLNSDDANFIAEEIHNELSMEYDNSGEIVERLFKPFKPWFIIPWIAYAFETSLSAVDVLSPWEEGKTFSLWVKLYTLSYSVVEFFLLIIQYICALKINGLHQKYCRNTRKLQMTAMDKSNTNEDVKMQYKAIARQLHVDNQVNYNFSPEIWGIHVNISMDSPLYAIILLLNAFVTLSQSFLDSNSRTVYVV